LTLTLTTNPNPDLARRYIAKLPYIILNQHTALARPLAKIVVRHLTRRSNPTDVADDELIIGAILSVVWCGVRCGVVWCGVWLGCETAL